jgi:hypothetical protein
VTRSVVEGLFETTVDGVRLVGSRCTGCATVYFPQAPGCRNPDCLAPALERTLLPDRGELVSYTVQRYRPPPLFRIDEWAPYAIGLVDLGDEVEVMGMIDGVDFEAIAIGAPMRLVVRPLYADEAGETVVTYAFALEAAS